MALRFPKKLDLKLNTCATGMVLLWAIYTAFCIFPVERLSLSHSAMIWGPLAHSEFSVPWAYSYRFDSSLNLYRGLEIFWLTLSIPPAYSFAFLSLFSSWYLCWNIARISKLLFSIPVPISLIAFLSFQETFVSGAFANDMVIALAIVAQSAIVILSRLDEKFPWLAFVLFSLAVTVRHDMILLIPWLCSLKLVISISGDRSLFAQARTFIIHCLTYLLVCESFFLIVGGSLKELYAGVIEHANQFVPTLLADEQYYATRAMAVPYLSILFSLVGILLLIKEKKLALVLSCCMAIVPTWYAYHQMLGSPKYLLPTALAFVPLAALTANYLLQYKRFERITITSLLLIFLVQGFVTPPNFTEKNANAGTKTSLWHYSSDSKSWTSDGPRLRYAYFFSSLQMRSARLQNQDLTNTFFLKAKELNQIPLCVAKSYSKDVFSDLRYALYFQGYRPTTDWATWEKPNQRSFVLAGAKKVKGRIDCEQVTFTSAH